MWCSWLFIVKYGFNINNLNYLLLNLIRKYLVLLGVFSMYMD